MFYAICEVRQYFSKSFDGTMCRVSKVLVVCDTKEDADRKMNIFDPARYGDYDTCLRVVREDRLDEEFR